MLDVATAIDEGDAHARAVPTLTSEQFSSSGAQVDQIIDAMEAKFRSNRAETASWIVDGWANLYGLESGLVESGEGLGSDEVSRIIAIAKSHEEYTEQAAIWTARAIKLFKKQSRLTAKVSNSLSTYIATYAARVEKVQSRDLEVFLEMSDHYRAIARAYDRENRTSAEFSDFDEVKAYLKSA